MTLYVVVPVFNAPHLLDRCLASIAEQDCEGFMAIIADDGSTDPGVMEVADRWMETEFGSHLILRRGQENVGALRNLVETIREWPMEPNSPVVIVDGDDRLAHPQALTRIRAILGHTTNLLTYGSYDTDPPSETCPPARPIPEWVLRAGCIRLLCEHDEIPWNHPVAFRRCLFDALDDSDFTMPDGSWQRFGYDVALMAPMIELAGARVEFCPETLYTYSSDRPESVGRIHAEATEAEGRHVIRQPRKYKPMRWDGP